jgi:hypothetical protein
MDLQEFFILPDYTFSLITTNILKKSSFHVLFKKVGFCSLRLSRASALLLFYFKCQLGGLLDRLNSSGEPSESVCFAEEGQVKFYFVVLKSLDMYGSFVYKYQIETHDPMAENMIKIFYFSRYEVTMFYDNRIKFQSILFQWDLISDVLSQETILGLRVQPLSLAEESRRAVLKALPCNRFLPLELISTLPSAVIDFLRTWDEGHFAKIGFWDFPL